MRAACHLFYFIVFLYSFWLNKQNLLSKKNCGASSLPRILKKLYIV